MLVVTPLLGGCAEHTVSIAFDPMIGDEFQYRSEITTVVDRPVDGEHTHTEESSVLDATETVTAVSDTDVTLDVALERDGAPARTYTSRYDRGDRLTAIDLIEGVPAEAIGYDLTTDLPADLTSPPAGPLRPGQRWEIERVLDTGDEPLRITGVGTVESLGVVDGRDIATVVIEVEIPVRSEITFPNATVVLDGWQRTRSVAVYDLAEGALVTDESTIEGDVDGLILPPPNVNDEPKAATVVYSIDVVTNRVF